MNIELNNELIAQPALDENGIRPCPFCGSRADVVDNRLGFYVKCRNDGCGIVVIGPRVPELGSEQEAEQIDWKALEQSAKDKWNRRVNKSPAYEIKGFGMFNATSLDLEGRNLATSIQCFHFERGTVPEHVFNQGIVVKHALQAIINALQLECDGMDDAPVQQIWPMAPQQEVDNG